MYIICDNFFIKDLQISEGVVNGDVKTGNTAKIIYVSAYMVKRFVYKKVLISLQYFTLI